MPLLFDAVLYIWHYYMDLMYSAPFFSLLMLQVHAYINLNCVLFHIPGIVHIYVTDHMYPTPVCLS